jgi:hypothetical protein
MNNKQLTTLLPLLIDSEKWHWKGIKKRSDALAELSMDKREQNDVFSRG